MYTLLGRSHLEGEANREHEITDQPHVHLTHYELFGLKVFIVALFGEQNWYGANRPKRP